MTDLFEYNPTPWSHARCGSNWDINLPSKPEDTGVGVVATVFAGEDIARFLAATPLMYDLLHRLAERTIRYVNEEPADKEEEEFLDCDAEMRALAKEARALLAEVRGHQ